MSEKIADQCLLTLEVIELIVLFADDNTRWNLLTVSHGFHLAVERINWSAYDNPSKKNLEQFLALYQGRRYRFLRHITMKFKFLRLQHIPRMNQFINCRETIDEINAQNELITCHIFWAFHNS